VQREQRLGVGLEPPAPLASRSTSARSTRWSRSAAATCAQPTTSRSSRSTTPPPAATSPSLSSTSSGRARTCGRHAAPPYLRPLPGRDVEVGL